VLNITAQQSSEGAKSYFAKSDYLSEGQELVGEWQGEAAKMLGLSGIVQKEDFDRLCDNINPRTGESLTAVTREGRRVGYDFTFSAPKSISVVHALTGDESILDAFRSSIHETMRDMEGEFATRVRKGGHDVDRPTGNWCVAEFVHLTSRPVNGVACPQLHMHAFTFNATYDAIEDQWKAGQFGDIKRDAYYWQAVQQARFANKLQAAGYSIRRTKDAFEIVGIPQSAMDKFSLRTQIIEQAAERLGIVNPKSKAKLGATTREFKNDRYSYGDLVEIWQKRLAPEELAAVSNAFADKHPGKPVIRNATHAQYAVDHSFERSSVVEERRLLALGLRHGCGEVTPEGIKAEADRCKLLKRIEGNRTWVTTREVLAEESRMIDFAAKGKATMRPLAEVGDPTRAVKLPLDKIIRADNAALSREQQAVIRHVMTSSDRVVMIRGAAGTGKSTLTKAAVEQIEQAGRNVLMLAPTTAAVDVLLRDEHSAYTVAEFLVSEKCSEQARDGVIWVDEASLVGTKTMASLFDAAKRLNARVILMGDRRQMGSVERGSTLRVLEDIAKVRAVEITDIRRQAGDYREAVKLLSKGKTLEGFDKLDSMGWVKPLNSYSEVAKDYADQITRTDKNGEVFTVKEPEREAIIVCPTHREGARITEAVRDELKNRGIVSEDEQEFEQMVSCQWTEAQRGDKDQYTGEEWLQFTRRGGGFEAGDRVQASSVDIGKLRPANFTTFNKRTIRVGKGDLIRLTGNGTSVDEHRLRNGAVYRVDGFDRDGNIVLDNGWKVGKDFGQFTHAYVNTYFAAQGRTSQHAIVVHGESSMPAVSAQGFYVAASRGRKSCTVYAEQPRELRDELARNKDRLSATELVAKPKPQATTRFKRAMARCRNAVVAAKKAAYELVQTNPREQDYAIER
jgi:conjugative relaxase-like TrwC/TraI family protein